MSVDDKDDYWVDFFWRYIPYVAGIIFIFFSNDKSEIFLIIFGLVVYYIYSSLDHTMNELHSKISSLEYKVDEFSSRIESLSSQIENLSNQIDSLSSVSTSSI